MPLVRTTALEMSILGMTLSSPYSAARHGKKRDELHRVLLANGDKLLVLTGHNRIHFFPNSTSVEVAELHHFLLGQTFRNVGFQILKPSRLVLGRGLNDGALKGCCLIRRRQLQTLDHRLHHL